ncbi:MAG: M48 family metalloprotease, partial [Bacteroidales bacterium]|nr:M48 family metalloprotease [Bacteroidales bacterium]
IKTIPQILYTNENIVIQAFGTFTQYYIVFNYDQLVRIINKDKINQSDNPKTLDTILIHELGHIRSGDVWKLGLSEKILKIILIYSILQLLLIFGNKYNLSSLLLLSPPERALFIFGWVGFVAFILLSIYILCTIGNLREYFADEIGVSQLSNYGSGFLNAALDVSIDQNEFNSLSVTSPRFLGNADTTRRSIVLKSGKYPREKIKQLVLIGGLSIGMAGFFGEDGLEILTCGIILGGLFMCFLYLLPGFSGNNRVTNYSPWQVIKIVCIFWIGITFMLLFKTLLVQLILWLNNVYPTIHVQFLLSDLQIIGLVTIYALLLVIALYGSIMIFQLFIDKFFKRSPQKIRLTYITFLSIVFGSLIFIVLDMGFKLMISLIT